MKNLIIFLNGNLGLKILDYLIQRRDTAVTAVVINGSNKIKPGYRDQVNTILSSTKREIELFQYSGKLWESLEFSKHMNSQTFGVSILFGHIFPESVVKKFNRNLINLHPSLLPIGRGADPIFWSIVDDLPQGATIHRVNELIDTGEILAQEEIKIDFWLNSGQIYDLIMAKLYQLFMKFYPSWDVTTPSVPQLGEGTYHDAQALSDIKSNMLETPGDLFKYLNLIQALTYNDGRKARVVLPNNEIWEVSLQLNRIKG
jgi:methionyl-tRNA formyltransferase